MIELKNYVPIPYHTEEDNKWVRKERVLIQYDKDDLERANFIGKDGWLYLPPAQHRTGFNVVEFSKVLASSGGWLKKGDNVATSYSILSIDIKDGKKLHSNYFIGDDEDGNAYAMPTVEPFNIVARFTDDYIEPISGVVFCEVPDLETEEKRGKLFIPNHLRKIDTQYKGFWTNILYINDKDSEDFKIKSGDTVYCQSNSDITINLKGNEYIRVPLQKILLKKIK